MFASALIVFREVLEAALVVGIVLAATRGVPGRTRWVSGGIALGVMGACVAALFAETITNAFAGTGQENLHATILLAAAVLIGWTVIWMRQHGRELAAQMKKVGQDVAAGETPLHMLAIVVGLAVLREGAETVLFLYGIGSSPNASAYSIALGGLFGLGGGTLIGYLLYAGLLRISSRHLFGVTSWLLALLAASMASQAAGYLIAVGELPAWGETLWNSEHILSEDSLAGQVLNILVGYESRPAGMQLVFYGATLLIIGLFLSFERLSFRKGARAALPLLIAGLLALPSPAMATHKVYSPLVEEGELGLEWRGHYDVDEVAARDDIQRHKFEVEYGFTDRLMVGVIGDLRNSATRDLRYNATAVEMVYTLFEPGSMPIDAGVYLEYVHADNESAPNKVEGKLLLEKTLGALTHTGNLIFEGEVGNNSSPVVEFKYAWSTKWRYQPYLMPGIEFHGALGDVVDFNTPRRQTHQAGPVLYGEVPLGSGPHKIAYEAGYLAGLSPTSPDHSFKWLLEYETYF